jgi:purine-nucleoside phosphorylase
MEAAALYMNQLTWAPRRCHRTISDHFITSECSTAEEREKTFTDMMKIALETVI